MIRIIVNGKKVELERSMSVNSYLDHIGLRGRKIAVALNGEVLHEEEHGAAIIADGDRVEVVRPIGGG